MRALTYRVALIAILGGCYGLTIAPDFTWAHFSADSGDLITAAAIDGVPHPAGYPLYLLFAKAVQYLPFGSLAFRTNLLSAVCTILAALLVFELIRDQLTEVPFQDQLALIGSLAYGLAPAVWSQALVTEVYALHGLLIALCLYLFSKPKFPEWLRGFVFGLAASNHLTSALLFPLLFLYGDIKKVALRFIGAASGLLLYLTLPLRAMGNPPVNWGNPSTVKGFLWLISGEAYRSYTLQLSVMDVVERLRAAAGLALEQFTALGLIFALYGLFSLHRSRVLLATGWASLTFLCFSVVYASYDSHVYLIVLWLCMAVWISIGLSELIQSANIPRKAAQAFPVIAAALLLTRIPFTSPNVDISSDTRALDFLEVTLTQIPQEAIVFTQGDEPLFSLWYARFALRRREDLIIVSEELLQFDWYNENLKFTYPSLSIPDKIQFQPSDFITANPGRQICRVWAYKVECP